MGLWDLFNAGNVVSSCSAVTTTTATAALPLPSTPNGSVYMTGWEVSATGVANTSTTIATVTGVVGGPLNYVIAAPFVQKQYDVPIKASGTQTQISIAANFGSSATVAIHGIQVPVGNVSLDPATVAIINAFTTPPTLARQILINNLVTSLKAAGVWNLLDVLYIFAAHDVQAATINWINPGTFTATASGAPTFAQDLGISGIGTSQYTTTYTPSTGPNFTANNASMGARSLTNYPSGDNSAQLIAAATNTTQITPRQTSTFGVAQVNGGTGFGPASGNSSVGFFVVTLSGGSSATLYQNGSSIASNGAYSPTGVSPGGLLMPNSFGGTTTIQVASAFAGGMLTAAQVLAFYNAEQAYMRAVGAA